MDIEGEISKLHIERGDVLVLKITDGNGEVDIFNQMQKFTKNVIEKSLGFEVPIIIMQKEMTLESVNKEDLQNIIDGVNGDSNG